MSAKKEPPVLAPQTTRDVEHTITRNALCLFYQALSGKARKKMTNHNRHVEMLKKAAAAFEKLPDDFELLNMTILDSDENEHIGLHVTAKKPNKVFPKLTDIDDHALHDYAMMAGIHMWFKRNTTGTGKPIWDYLHALDENGTEIYQGIQRRDDYADTGTETAPSD